MSSRTNRDNIIEFIDACLLNNNNSHYLTELLHMIKNDDNYFAAMMTFVSNYGLFHPGFAQQMSMTWILGRKAFDKSEDEE